MSNSKDCDGSCGGHQENLGTGCLADTKVDDNIEFLIRITDNRTGKVTEEWFGPSNAPYAAEDSLPERALYEAFDRYPSAFEWHLQLVRDVDGKLVRRPGPLHRLDCVLHINNGNYQGYWRGSEARLVTQPDIVFPMPGECATALPVIIHYHNGKVSVYLAQPQRA